MEIPNLIGILRQRAPATFKSLSISLRGSDDWIPIGRLAGEPEKAALTLAELTEIAMAGLQELEPMVQPGLTEVTTRLRRSGRWELIGEIVAAFSSTGVIAAIWGQPAEGVVGDPVAIGLAFVALIGSIASLGARYMRRDLVGNDNGMASLLKTLSEGAWESKTLLAKLNFIKEKGPAAAEDARPVIERAEKLATELYGALKSLDIKIA
jgi:hypothetical protein